MKLLIVLGWVIGVALIVVIVAVAVLGLAIDWISKEVDHFMKTELT